MSCVRVAADATERHLFVHTGTGILIMRGTMLVYRADGGLDIAGFDRTPTLDELQAVVGGYIEHVPAFDTIAYMGTIMHCVALCNESGKLDHLPRNDNATTAWSQAVRRHGFHLQESLFGTVAVLFGDREFMSDL
jgi:hypothetical protein